MKEQILKYNNRLDGIKEKLNIRHVRVIVFLIILTAQIGLMIFWAEEKSNYFIDELYSYGYAHSYTFDKSHKRYITQSDDWQYEKWIDNEVLKEKLEVKKEESLLSRPFFTAVRMLLTRRNHQGILNILMSILSPGRISKVPGIILNLIIFALTQIVLYKMGKEMTESPCIALLIILMYGFSAIAIGNSIYIRFYALVILLLLLVFRLHQKMWYTVSSFRNEGYIILSIGLIYLAIKNSELVFILAGTLIPVFFCALLVKRDSKKATQYLISIVPLCAFYACKKTDYVDIILHPSAYLQSEGPKGWMTQNLMRFSPEQMKSMLGTYLDLLSFQLFGSWYVLCCFVIVILILLEAFCIEKKPDTTNEGIKGFCWVLFIVSIIYTVFAFVTGLQQPRYWSLVFPLLSILLWKLIDTLTKKSSIRNLVLAGCTILTLTGIITGELKHSDRLSYVYRDDRQIIKQIQETEIRDCIVIYVNLSNCDHSIYDSIHLLPENARLYPVKEEQHYIDVQSCPDELLIWNLLRQNLQPYVEDLTRNGYSIEKFGSTHASDVYIAKRAA